MKKHIVDCAACDENFKDYSCALHKAAPELLAAIEYALREIPGETKLFERLLLAYRMAGGSQAGR